MAPSRCTSVTALAALATLAALPRIARADDSPVAAYRSDSFGMTTGMETTFALFGGLSLAGDVIPSGSGGSSGFFQLGFDGRYVRSGVMVGAGLQVFFQDGSMSTIVSPHLSVGYAIPISDRLALTPSVHGSLQDVPDTGGIGFFFVRGEVALEYFFGRHGYIEPVVTVGDLVPAGDSSGSAVIVGIGYRLGVVF